MIKKNCQITDEGCRLSDITISSLEKDILLKDHIILCGLTYNVHKFLIPLRHKSLKSFPPVVILNEEPPGVDLWMKLRFFPELYYIKGCPMNPKDLKKANLGSAACVVLLSDSLAELRDPTSGR